MSYTADLAFQLIAGQRGSLPEDRLQQALQEAEGRGVLLERYLVDRGEMTRDERAAIASIRKKHAKSCLACRKTTFLLPGQDLSEPCEHCGGSLGPYIAGQTGRVGGRPGTGALDRPGTGALRRPSGAHERPAEPATTKPAGFGWSPDQDPPRPPQRPRPPRRDDPRPEPSFVRDEPDLDGPAEPEPASQAPIPRMTPRGWEAPAPPPPRPVSVAGGPPRERSTRDWRRPEPAPGPAVAPVPVRTGPELQGWQAQAATSVARARAQHSSFDSTVITKLVMSVLIVAVLGVLYVVFSKVSSSIFHDNYTWHKRYFKAEDAARNTGKLLIVMRENPRDIKTDKFKKHVLNDSRVTAYAEEFIWFKEDTNGALGKRRDDDYHALRGTGGSPFPHIFVYTPDGACVDGTMDAASMDASAFAAFLEEMKLGDFAGGEEEDY